MHIKIDFNTTGYEKASILYLLQNKKKIDHGKQVTSYGCSICRCGCGVKAAIQRFRQGKDARSKHVTDLFAQSLKLLS